MAILQTRKLIFGMMAGLIAYAIIGKLGLYLLKISWADYAVHSKNKSYTLAMLLCRLVVAIAAAIAASIASAKVEKGKVRSAWVVGIIVCGVSSYIHLLTIVWPQYPVWYHFSFLLPIIPLTGLSHYLFLKRNDQ